MPESAYFGGHGNEVMAEMKARHGDKLGRRFFYATANKQKQAPPKKRRALSDYAKK